MHTMCESAGIEAAIHAIFLAAAVGVVGQYAYTAPKEAAPGRPDGALRLARFARRRWGPAPSVGGSPPPL